MRLIGSDKSYWAVSPRNKWSHSVLVPYRIAQNPRSNSAMIGFTCKFAPNQKNRIDISPQQLMRTTSWCTSTAPACASYDSLSHMMRGLREKVKIQTSRMMMISDEDIRSCASCIFTDTYSNDKTKRARTDLLFCPNLIGPGFSVKSSSIEDNWPLVQWGERIRMQYPGIPLYFISSPLSIGFYTKFRTSTNYLSFCLANRNLHYHKWHSDNGGFSEINKQVAWREGLIRWPAISSSPGKLILK